MRKLAETTGESMFDVEHRRKYFLPGLAENYLALRAREGDWADELAEREAWDGAGSDDDEESQGATTLARPYLDR